MTAKQELKNANGAAIFTSEGLRPISKKDAEALINEDQNLDWEIARLGTFVIHVDEIPEASV